MYKLNAVIFSFLVVINLKAAPDLSNYIYLNGKIMTLSEINSYELREEAKRAYLNRREEDQSPSGRNTPSLEKLQYLFNEHNLWDLFGIKVISPKICLRLLMPDINPNKVQISENIFSMESTLATIFENIDKLNNSREIKEILTNTFENMWNLIKEEYELTNIEDTPPIIISTSTIHIPYVPSSPSINKNITPEEGIKALAKFARNIALSRPNICRNSDISDGLQFPIEL